VNNTQNISDKIGIHLLTSFAIREGFDLRSTTTAIERACAMNLVRQIHILSETSKIEAEQALPLLKHPKIEFITLPRRPTFKKLFDYANQLDINKNEVVALINSDVSFAEESDIVRSVHVLDLARARGYLGMLTITRHDIVDGKPELSLRDRTGLPNFLTCDCWVFRPPVTPIGDYFSLGQMNSDSFIAYNMAEAGYCLINPCLDIILIHHEMVKGIEFYEGENREDTSLALIGWHWSKQCNRPFKTYGVPWTSSEMIENGYLPLPLVNQKKRIYLAINKNSTTSVLAVASLTEVISRTHERDLVVLIEHAEEEASQLVSELGAVSRNVYFILVANLNEVIDNLISEKNCYGDSCALISRFDYLTTELINQFHSVIFDARKLGINGEIYAPVGHQHLETITRARYQKVNLDEAIKFPETFCEQEYCTLITSIFRSDKYLAGFKKNITALDGYARYPHILLFSKISNYERGLLNKWHYDHDNTILCWFETDPGLYDCWNIGIRITQSHYVSNANVDDLRHPNHVSLLIGDLQKFPNASIAATAVIPFFKYIEDLNLIDKSSPWYADQAGIFEFEDLAKLDHGEDGSWKLTPHNIPHCMPVWRKSLHDAYGYFDETKYGTYADWAYWLKVTKSGEVGYLNKNPFAFYYVNQGSHNRRSDQLARLHKIINDEFIADFLFRNKIIKEFLTGSKLAHIGNKVNSIDRWPKKLFLEGLSKSFGQHRNSFKRLIEALRPLHNEAGGIRFIPFIERYFAWGADEGEAASTNPKPILQDWIGILHVPFDAPKWFEYSTSPEYIFTTELWRKSFPYCRGIICLTKDLERDLQFWYPDLPTLAVKFPTELDVICFDSVAYMKNPKIVQAGDWLRRLQFIYEINAPMHQKVFLKKLHTDHWLNREKDIIGDFRGDFVKVMNYVSNEEYDHLLASSVVAIWLYGSAANNIVCECISRRTPLLVNPLPSVVEYLGREYPLYITKREEASKIINNHRLIKITHDYLDDMVDLRNSLSYENFLLSIAQSKFYERL
jgi:hypothetical protein